MRLPRVMGCRTHNGSACRGVLPESTATYYQRPDVVWASITDISPSEVRLGWAATHRTPLIAEFVVLAEAAAKDATRDQLT
jgi:hypothetical protein